MAGVKLRTESINPLTYAEVDNNFAILRKFQEQGFPEYDSDITYQKGAWVLGSNGVVYYSTIDGNDIDPLVNTGDVWDNNHYPTTLQMRDEIELAKQQAQAFAVSMAIALG